MTVTQAAAILHITVQSLIQRVYDRRIRPDQPIGSAYGHDGGGPRGWTFTADEIERYRQVRDAGIEARRSWNGARGQQQAVA